MSEGYAAKAVSAVRTEMLDHLRNDWTRTL